MKKILLSSFISIVVVSNSLAGDLIKIMPVGDSITAGEHYQFPAIEERTGYRKDLYKMLINAEYNVDFVGSQNHGERSKADNKDWYDWNCEAYPGWQILVTHLTFYPTLTANKLKTKRYQKELNKHGY